MNAFMSMEGSTSGWPPDAMPCMKIGDNDYMLVPVDGRGSFPGRSWAPAKRSEPQRFSDPILSKVPDFVYDKLPVAKKRIRLLRLQSSTTHGPEIFCDMLEADYDNSFHIPTKATTPQPGHAFLEERERSSRMMHTQSSAPTVLDGSDGGATMDETETEVFFPPGVGHGANGNLSGADRVNSIEARIRGQDYKETLLELEYKRVMEEKIDYEALSWCWGNSDEDYAIMIKNDNNTYKKKVRRELALALQYLRKPHENRILWIDAICINQADHNERNHQVQMMAHIYSRASTVCVWLGEGDKDSNLAINFIRDEVLNLGKFDILSSDKTYIKKWQALMSLMQRAWFSRRWVIQEIALATKAQVYCGPDSISWEQFTIAVELFVQVESSTHRLSEVMKTDERFQYVPGWFEHVSELGANLLVQATGTVFRVQRNPTVDGSIAIDQQDETYRALHGVNTIDPLERKALLSLEHLVATMSIFETSEPRDVVYALLAIAQDAAPFAAQSAISGKREESRLAMTLFEPFLEEKPFVVDYGRAYTDVCRDFVEFCILRKARIDPTQALDILCRPWAAPMPKRKPKPYTVPPKPKLHRITQRRSKWTIMEWPIVEQPKSNKEDHPSGVLRYEHLKRYPTVLEEVDDSDRSTAQWWLDIKDKKSWKKEEEKEDTMDNSEENGTGRGEDLNGAENGTDREMETGVEIDNGVEGDTRNGEGIEKQGENQVDHGSPEEFARNWTIPKGWEKIAHYFQLPPTQPERPLEDDGDLSPQIGRVASWAKAQSMASAPNGAEEDPLERNIRQLPSWVAPAKRAPFALYPHPGIHGTKTGRANADPLVGAPRQANKSYTASQNEGVRLNKLKFRKRAVTGHYSLYVEGFEIDRIAEVQDPSQGGNIPKAWLEMGNWEEPYDRTEPPEELWRTLVADRGVDNRNPPHYYSKAFKASVFKGGVAGGQVNIPGLIHNERSSVISEFCRRVQSVVWGRSLFRTTKGRLGLGTNIQKGDLVCILYGCSVPVVLRENMKSDKDLEEEEMEDAVEALKRVVQRRFRRFETKARQGQNVQMDKDIGIETKFVNRKLEQIRELERRLAVEEKKVLAEYKEESPKLDSNGVESSSERQKRQEEKFERYLRKELERVKKEALKDFLEDDKIQLDKKMARLQQTFAKGNFVPPATRMAQVIKKDNLKIEHRTDLKKRKDTWVLERLTKRKKDLEERWEYEKKGKKMGPEFRTPWERKKADMKKNQHRKYFDFIGEAYVHGLMDGEGVRESFYAELPDLVYELR